MLVNNEPISTPQEIDWSAYDPESGIKSITATEFASTAGMLRKFSEFELCTVANVVPNNPYCPTSEAETLTINPHEIITQGHVLYSPSRLGDYVWTEGLHKIAIESVDKSGNTSGRHDEGSISFVVDRTPPRVSGLTVAGGAEWVSDPILPLSWENVPADRSGVSKVEFNVQPTEAGQLDPPPATATGFDLKSAQTELPGPGMWRIDVRTYDRAGNASDLHQLDVGLDQVPPPAPQLDEIGWVGADFLTAHDKLRWTMPDPSPRSGICGYAVIVDGFATTQPSASVTHAGDIDEIALMSETKRAGATHIYVPFPAAAWLVIRRTFRSTSTQRPPTSKRVSAGPVGYRRSSSSS